MKLKATEYRLTKPRAWLMMILILISIHAPARGSSLNKADEVREGAQAESEGDSLLVGAIVRVRSFDPTTRTYRLTIVGEVAVGPNIVRLEDLVRSVGSIDLKSLKRRPKSIIGNEYELKHELPLQ